MAAVSENKQYELADLVQQHQAGTWRYLRFLGADGAEAEDLLQETFLAVIRSSFVYRSRGETAAYLRQVARNQLLQARRRDGRQVNTVELRGAEQVWAEVAAEDGLDEYLSALEVCLSRLKNRARQVVDLHYREGLGRAEIAARLQMKPEGVKTVLRRARQLLRLCVERKVKP
jgi:RNA polymerase sigma-70 factor (ECF subfamily)